MPPNKKTPADSAQRNGIPRRRIVAAGLGAMLSSGCGPSSPPPPSPLTSGSLPMLPAPPKQFVTDFLPLPYELLQTRLAGVVFREGATGVFQSLVDETLNRVIGSDRFELLLPGVGIAGFFHFGKVQSVQPTPPPPGAGPPWGFLKYDEATIAIPVRDTDTGAVCIFTPVMMLSDFLALVAGREVVGFPKVLGQFDSTGLATDATPTVPGILPVDVKVSVEGFATSGATVQAGSHQVMRGELELLAAWFENSTSKSPDNFIEDLNPTSLSPPVNLAWQSVKPVVKALLNPQLQGAFLKQFPACDDVTRACYQKVILAPYRVTALRRIRLGVGRVTFNNPASYRLAEALSHTPGAQTGLLGFIAETDWMLGAGHEI